MVFLALLILEQEILELGHAANRPEGVCVAIDSIRCVPRSGMRH